MLEGIGLRRDDGRDDYGGGPASRRFAGTRSAPGCLACSRWSGRSTAGQRAGIELLRQRPGDLVLDLGCGTGLDFAALDAATDPAGAIVGVDRSVQMLARAQARMRADAAGYDYAAVFGAVACDALIGTYAPSVIADGASAWRSALTAIRSGRRAAVIDLALPCGCGAAGPDLYRCPLQWVERDIAEVDRRMLRGGHVRVAAGTVTPQGQR